MKNTKARNEIFNIIDSANEPVSAESIFRDLIEKNITLSTVYRTLNTFCTEGLIKKEIDKSNKAVYTKVKSEHSHMLVCEKCHKRIVLKECPYHKLNDKIEKETGFVVNDQNTIIYGLCKECRK